jgi:hypothetical protein
MQGEPLEYLVREGALAAWRLAIDEVIQLKPNIVIEEIEHGQKSAWTHRWMTIANIYYNRGDSGKS